MSEICLLPLLNFKKHVFQIVHFCEIPFISATKTTQMYVFSLFFNIYIRKLLNPLPPAGSHSPLPPPGSHSPLPPAGSHSPLPPAGSHSPLPPAAHPFRPMLAINVTEPVAAE